MCLPGSKHLGFFFFSRPFKKGRGGVEKGGWVVRLQKLRNGKGALEQLTAMTGSQIKSQKSEQNYIIFITKLYLKILKMKTIPTKYSYLSYATSRSKSFPLNLKIARI